MRRKLGPYTALQTCSVNYTLIWHKQQPRAEYRILSSPSLHLLRPCAERNSLGVVGSYCLLKQQNTFLVLLAALLLAVLMAVLMLTALARVPEMKALRTDFLTGTSSYGASRMQ